MYNNDQNNNAGGALTQVILFLVIIGLLTIFGLGVYVGLFLQMSL